MADFFGKKMLFWLVKCVTEIFPMDVVRHFTTNEIPDEESDYETGPEDEIEEIEDEGWLLLSLLQIETALELMISCRSSDNIEGRFVLLKLGYNLKTYISMDFTFLVKPVQYSAEICSFAKQFCR